MNDWDRFNDQFREPENERNERLAAARRKRAALDPRDPDPMRSGIEDSHTTPAEAVAELHAEIERLRTSLAQANAAADAEMERVKACEHIAEGTEGWEVLRNLCPSAAAVAGLRDAYEARRLTLCEDCPPMGYPTDKTRWTECPRREGNPCLASLASNEPCKPDAENLRRCTICGFVVDLTYIAEKPA